MADAGPSAAEIAKQIVSNPQRRAKFLRDENKVVAQAVKRSRRFGRVDPETENKRSEVVTEFFNALEDNSEAASALHARAVMIEFFEAAIRNPERSFITNLLLSILAFLVGVALMVAGVVTGLSGDASTQDTVIASLFGATGVIGTLGVVFNLASKGVSRANADHAQIRLVLTGFATELGHLRSIKLDGLKNVDEVNQKIREATTDAVRMIGTQVKDSGR